MNTIDPAVRNTIRLEADTQSHIRTSLSQSAVFVMKGSMLAYLSGAAFGSTYAIIRNVPRAPIVSFIYAANWLIVGSSFLSIREALLYYRHFVNSQKNIPNHMARSIDELVASASSGAILGAILGFHTSGPWAIPGGALAYGTLFSLGQIAYNLGRVWRQNYALDKCLHPEKYAPNRIMGSSGWFTNRLTPPETTINLNNTPDAPSYSWDETREKIMKWDPMEWVVNLTRDIGRDYIIGGEYPEWASPFVNAFDIHHKRQLKKQLVHTEMEVNILKEAIQEKETLIASSKN